MQQGNHTPETEVQIHHSNTAENISVPIDGDLATLLELQELKEITVHGRPILLNAQNVDSYLKSDDSAIKSYEDLGELLAQRMSKEDVEKIYNQQLHRRIVGQEFKVDEVGSFQPKDSEDLVLIVPKVKLSVEVVERAIESIENDDLSKYTVYLPPTTQEEILNPIRCVTGHAMREFLNSMQDEETGGLDMNSQIAVYAKLLTLMPDDDPTKKKGLFDLRALMQYGDVVSNKNLRLALTALIEEE